MTATHQRSARETDALVYARMMAAVREPDSVSVNRHRKILEHGRRRLVFLARRLAHMKPASDDAQFMDDLRMLRRFCQLQYLWRRRELVRAGKDLAVWAAEPAAPRRVGSRPDLVARANRMAASTGDGDAVARELADLVRAAWSKPAKAGR